jgi:hypothetical protein
MSFLAAALFGIIPAVRVSRSDANSVIKQSGEAGYLSPANLETGRPGGQSRDSALDRRGIPDEHMLHSRLPCHENSAIDSTAL